MSDYTIRVAYDETNTATGCAVGVAGDTLTRPITARAGRGATRSDLPLIMISEAVKGLSGFLREGDLVSIEMAGAKGYRRSGNALTTLRSELARLRAKGVDIAFRELDQPGPDMSQLTRKAAYSALIGI